MFSSEKTKLQNSICSVLPMSRIFYVRKRNKKIYIYPHNCPKINSENEFDTPGLGLGFVRGLGLGLEQGLGLG